MSVLVLAGGKGTRFYSQTPKVMHRILGKPMIWYVVNSAIKSGAKEVVVVVGFKGEEVERYLKKEFPQVKIAHQREQLGTAHAVLCAKKELTEERVVVLNGDMPLVESELIKRLSESNSDLTIVSMILEDPTGYGRILRENRKVVRIVEEKDASPAEKQIKEVNSGVYSFNREKLFKAIEKISPNNAQGEYYLTDAVEIFLKNGWKVDVIVEKDSKKLIGVNNRYELSVAENLMKEKLLKNLMKKGTTIHNPGQAYIEPEVEIEEDVEIFAPVFICGKTKIKRGSVIYPFTYIRDSLIGENVVVESHSWIEGSVIENDSRVGPFAKLRKGTHLEEGAKVGTFVETKNAKLGRGVKANHLSYLGDCEIGEGTNIGAGTITCNYDGFAKWKTEIGKNVFVGSNTLFVAPVKVGDDSITAAGSVITSNVPPNSLAIARSKQVNHEGKAERIREKFRRRKVEHSGTDSKGEEKRT